MKYFDVKIKCTCNAETEHEKRMGIVLGLFVLLTVIAIII